MTTGEALARALGVFSLALGLAQLAAPRRFAATIGVRPDPQVEPVVRAVGVREIAAAAGLLARPRPARFLWMRVVGDLMDLALLTRAVRSARSRGERVTAATLAVLGVTALDLAGSVQLTAAGDRDAARRRRLGEMPVHKAVTVQRSPEEVYAFWHDFENLPKFMQHVEAVWNVGERRTHWVVRGPAGLKVEWDAAIVADRPNELISWRTVEGSDVEHSGTVRFEPAPGGRGTEVHADFVYKPPAGPLGAALARLFGEEPEQQAADDLRRFKQVIEAGEVIRSEATLGERRVRQRPAQPVPSAA